MRPLASVSDQDREAVLALSSRMPDGFEWQDVAEVLGTNRNRTYRLMARLREDGLIGATWVGQGAKWTTTDRLEALRDRLKAEFHTLDKARRAKYMREFKRARSAPKPEPVYHRCASVFEWGQA